jgi:hypothetical protein
MQIQIRLLHIPALMQTFGSGMAQTLQHQLLPGWRRIGLYQIALYAIPHTGIRSESQCLQILASDWGLLTFKLRDAFKPKRGLARRVSQSGLVPLTRHATQSSTRFGLNPEGKG